MKRRNEILIVFDNLIAILFEFAKVIKGNESPTLQRLSKNNNKFQPENVQIQYILIKKL